VHPTYPAPNEPVRTPRSYPFNIHIPIKEAFSVIFIIKNTILSNKQEEFLALFAECKINEPVIAWSYLSPNVSFWKYFTNVDNIPYGQKHS
jgi:hypothetical protein